MGLLSEIAVLAKAGYSVAEVKELLSMAQTEPPAKPEAEQPPEKEPEKKPDQKPAQRQDPKPSRDQSPDQSPEQSPPQSPDLLQKIADLEKQLKEAQEANINQNANASRKTEQEQLEELARSFM